MDTTAAQPLPRFYQSLDQVRSSGLLSPARLAELEVAIEARLSVPLDPDGLLPITNARLADLSPHGRYLYTGTPGHDDPWHYAKQQILSVVLTEAERKLLSDCAFSAASQRREDEAFAKAKHVPAEEWDGWVTDGNQYWDSVEAYMDDVAEGDEQLMHDPGDETLPLRPYVWAARPEQIITSRNVEDVFESQMCDRGWEDMDIHDLNGVPELQAAIEAFVKANESVVAYHEDRRTAVLFPRSIASTTLHP